VCVCECVVVVCVVMVRGGGGNEKRSMSGTISAIDLLNDPLDFLHALGHLGHCPCAVDQLPFIITSYTIDWIAFNRSSHR
jgi:hypothetical protein